MSSTSKLSHIYNPANQSDQELLDGFIMRGNTFKTIMQAVKNNHGKQPAQHFLIEAQRGMGKTSLLLRTRIEIEQDASLAQLLPVQLAEEQYGIFQLCQLWEHIADELCEYVGFENLANDFEAIDSQSDYAANCYTLLEDYLKKNRRQLVLMLDNFGDVLKRLTEIEQDRLRDILQSSTSIQLIATSAKALEASYKHDNSLFELFEVLYLKGLDKKDSHTLLKKLAKTNQQLPKIEHIIKNQPERIESLRQLTGGVPRTLVILYEIFVDDNGNVFEDLESILDRVTPLYKDRMDDLPKQQQAIMNALALNWDGISTKEITARLNNPQLTSKKIASQLNQLEKSGLVISKRVDKKNKLYFLQERFFNIWYLMRYGRKKSKSKVLWLIRFFQSWYTPEELKQRALQHIKAAQSGDLHPRGGILMAETLRYTVDDIELQDDVVKATRKALYSEVSDIDQQLSKSDRELLKPAKEAAKNKDFDLGIKYYLKLVKQNCTPAMNSLALLYKSYKQVIHYYQMAVDKGHAGAMFNLALLYESAYKDYKQAIHYYQMAVDKGHARAMKNLALLYESEYKDYKQAIHYYQMAVDKGDADAMFNLALLYESEYKDYKQAIHYYQMGVDKGDAGAMYNLALLYKLEYKDYKQVIHYYQMAVDKGHAGAMFNLALLYKSEYKDYKQAIHYYQMAVDKGHASAMFNLANLYKSEYKDYKQAIHYYQMAVDKGHANAMYNLALLYELDYKDYKQAIHYYQMAVDKGHANAMYNLALLYELEYKDYKQAIHYYQMAVDKGHAGAMKNLAYLYESEYKDYKQAIHYYQMAVDKGDLQVLARAMFNLAYLYESEYKDYKQAIHYYQMAVDKGDLQVQARAMYNLANLYTSENKDYKQAIHYYQMAVDKGDAGAMKNLALLYESEYKDYKQAIHYYQMAVDKGDAGAMNNLAWLYYQQAINQQDSLTLAKQSFLQEPNQFISHTLATVQLWNNQFNESLQQFKDFYQGLNKKTDQKQINRFSDYITDYLILLLSKQQLSVANDLFQQFPALKDQFKPVYYALMTLQKEQYPKEYLRMGSELEETVQGILKKVEEKAQKYA